MSWGGGGTEVFMGLEGDREIGVKREKVCQSDRASFDAPVPST